MKILSSVQRADGLLAKGLVTSEADLANVPDYVVAGSRFRLAGYSKVWELGENGQWNEVAIGGGGGSFNPDINNPQDGNTLVYDASAGKWVNGSSGGGVFLVHRDQTGWYLDKTYNQIKTAANAGKVVIFVNNSNDGGSAPSVDNSILSNFKEYHGYDSNQYDVYFGSHYFYGSDPDGQLVMPD